MINLYFFQDSLSEFFLYEVFERNTFGKIVISRAGAPFFRIVEKPVEADIIMVPCPISSLMNPDGKKILDSHIQLAKSLEKPCVVVSNSDLVFDPGDPEVFIITPGPYSFMSNQIAIPALLSDDPVQKWYHGEWKPIIDFSTPTVGFCGQATENIFKWGKDLYRVSSLKWDIWRKKSNYLYVPFFMAAHHRAKLLKSLQNSRIIKTNFLLRKKYRGGSKTLAEQEKMEFEFFNNIEQNLFTVSFRGFGNYSVRFFQTLAMGRIPVHIVTNSVLPFEKFISYDEIIVKVPFEERFKLDMYISDFMLTKSPEELVEIQKKCRQLWKDHFTLEGSLKLLAQELEEIIRHQKEMKNDTK